MKIKSNVRTGGPILQHNQTVKGLRVKSSVKAGGATANHSQALKRAAE